MTVSERSQIRLDQASERQRRYQNRDEQTGQYAFDGDLSRLCVCGHTLGNHIAGGFECMLSPECSSKPTCDCLKFRMPRKRRAAR